MNSISFAFESEFGISREDIYLFFRKKDLDGIIKFYMQTFGFFDSIDEPRNSNRNVRVV